MPALLALVGVHCFQDLLVEPSQPVLNFSVTPSSAVVPIGDTVAPFQATLTADGIPLEFQLRVAVTQGGDVLQADSVGRIVALRRGVARLEARPLLSEFTSDTMRRTVTAQAIVPRLGVPATPSVDTLTSLGDTINLRAAALTRRGDTIPGVPIVWRQLSGSSSVQLLDSTVGRARAASNGLAEFLASVDTATAQRQVCVVQVPKSVSAPDSARLTSLGQTVQLSAAVRDARGNAVADSVPTWASLQPGIATVDPATGLVTAVANGPARIEARVGSLADTTSVTVSQVPRKLAFTVEPQTATAGQAIIPAIWVAVQDSLGNTVTGFTGNVTVGIGTNPGGGTLSGTTTAAAVAGVATFSTLSINKAGTSYTFRASSGTLAADTSAAFSITSAAARTLALVSGDDQGGAVGAALAAPLVVAVRDTFANAVAGREVWFTVTRGGGKLAGQDSVLLMTNAQGQASATLTVGTVPDTNRVTVTSAGLAGSPLTFSAVAVAGPVRTLRVVSGNDQSGLVGAVLAEPFVVAAQDTFGNATAGRQIRFNVMRGGGKLDGLDSVVVATNAQGRASTTLMLGTAPDTNRVTATSTEMASSPVTFSAVAVARQAYQLVKVSGDSQTAQVGQLTAHPFVVAVRDTFGNAVGGTVVSFRVVAGGGRFNGVDSLVDTTDAEGLATALLTVSGTEMDTTQVAASAAGLVGSPANFIASSAPIPVAQVVVAPRGASISGVGATFQFTAEARDAGGTVLPRSFAWASSNPNVATVGLTSGLVTAVASGEVTISATAGGSVGYALLTVAVPGATPVNLWTSMASGTTQPLYSVSGWAGPDIHAVGSDGTVLRYDGTSWRAMTSGTSEVLYGVWGTSGSDIYAVGLNGTVLRYDGTSWGTMTSGTSQHLSTVWGTSPSDVYAVGLGGTILRYNGTSWGTIASGTLSGLRGLWGTSSSDIYAVGEFGTILRYDGTSWSAMTSGTSQHLNDVWGTSESDIYAVGNFGTVLHYDGTVWSALTSAAGQYSIEVWGTSNSDIYAVGLDGTISRYDGTSWDAVTSGTSHNLLGVWGTSSSDVYAVGLNGTILRGVRGATVTVTPPSPTLTALGATVQLVAEARRASGDTLQGASFTWSSSNSNVARVDVNGLVTALAQGTATITATAPGGANGSATVTVSDAEWVAARFDAGLAHTCGLTTDGAAYCWGDNSSGQLGDGTTTYRTSPVAVSGGLSFQAISAGGSHTCGLTTDGAAYCWGSNSNGQLGGGTSGNSTAPVAVSGGLVFQAISAGYVHTCGLTTGGAAYCWGTNGNGQLGDGTTSTRTSPVAVAGGLVFRAISAGSLHTCGLTTGRAAYCWGDNRYGQLGDGASSNSSIPVAVSGGLTFQAISAGSWHTCGLTTGAAAYCWGSNSSGQLGDGTLSSRTSPVTVSGGFVFQVISAGFDHTCGLTTSGAAYCWGLNFYGQLGDGTTNNRTSPVAVAGGLTFRTISAGGMFYDDPGSHTCALTADGVAYCWGADPSSAFRASPVAVSSGLTFQAISAGFIHTCGLTTGRAAFCWGNNSYGQLSDGTGSSRTIPVPILGNLALDVISAGAWHTCGLTTGGAAYCWGGNSSGQLGDGTTSGSTAPVAVLGSLSFQTISAGEEHTCGLTTGGAAYCWGGNSSGQLGDGTTSNRTSPAAVAGSLTFRAISAGYDHTCGLTTGKAAYCWGNNLGGQLGDGTSTNRTSPVSVLGDLTLEVVSAGAGHTCGLTTAGTGYCWGYNDSGQLGDGTTSGRTAPVAVSGSLTFQTISTGGTGRLSDSGRHTCGLTTGAAAYCWGSNVAGQLGDGTRSTRTSPAAVLSGFTFEAVSASGWAHTCGLTTGGATYCWGFNFYGQLGDGTGFRPTPVAVVGGVVFGAPAVTPSAATALRLRAQ